MELEGSETGDEEEDKRSERSTESNNEARRFRRPYTAVPVQEYSVTVPLLRPEFPVGASALVEAVNQDKANLNVDKLMWQKFNNYQWESNEETDNSLFAGVLAEQSRRFKYTKPSDPFTDKVKFAREMIKSADIDIDMFKTKPALRQQARFIGYPDDEYEGKGKYEGEVHFHDVFLPDWASIPESHPLNKFTATNGCQIPDSERLAGGKFSSYDWDSQEGTNQFIFTTLS